MSSSTRRHPAPATALYIAVGASLLSPAALVAQGAFVNYEVGAVQPIVVETFTAGSSSREVLFVCNTADDALEVYDASSRALIARIPTGLSPVTVRWDPVSQRAYTCNFIGDSITCVDVSASEVGGAVQLDVRLAATRRVGDEPSDLAFVPGTGATDREAVVSLRSRSGVAHIDLETGALLDGRFSPTATGEATGEQWGVKNPRNARFVGNRYYLLDHHSGIGEDDIDLYVAENAVGGIDILTAPVTEFTLHDLGTTHSNYAINAAGDRMYVVGMRATPELEDQEVDVGDLPTGFTQSWLWVVEMNPTGTPETRIESTGPLSFQPSINLNRNYSNITQTDPPLVEVSPGDALAQPTGVALVEDGGQVTKVVVTAFSSDKVAVLTPSFSSHSGWDIEQLDLSPLASYSMSGPRAVAIDAAGTTAFVACTLDNSVRVVDISGATPVLAATLPLLADDTPAVVRQGREFLYGAVHSGNRMVSCSSCHIDGHTDALAWTLNQGHQGTLPPGFKNADNLPVDWLGEKGPMVTQTLRGLVNHDIDGEAQNLATNAPYHWRGDRADFAAFNGAFPDLLSRPGDEISGTEMATFTAFVETIPHPPNPEQPIDRRLSGSMGDPALTESSYDPTLGDGMKRGLKLYHAANMELTCAHCHALPDGSGNRATQTFNHNGVVSPIEPAALRHLFDREATLQVGPGLIGSTDIWLSEKGLTHAGVIANVFPSVSHFVQNRFTGNMPGPDVSDQIVDLNEFVRGLDAGTAPIIGFAYTCDGSLDDGRALALMLDQVQEANAGLVAHVDVGGVAASYWYDLTLDSFRDDTTSASLSQAALLALVTGTDVVVLQSVPVGSARRIADYGGSNATSSGVAPSSVTLEPLALPTHWQDGGDLRARWAKGLGPYQLANLGPRESHDRQLYMQVQLLRAAGSPSFVDFGINTLDHLKHELPRRFRVAGDDIRYGAVLELTLPQTVGSGVLLSMPLFPTDRTNTGGQRIWETSIEVDGEMALALLCGGPFLDNVAGLLDFTQTPSVDPVADNNYAWTVRNTDNTSAGGTSRLTIQHSR